MCLETSDISQKFCYKDVKEFFVTCFSGNSASESIFLYIAIYSYTDE